MSGLFGILLLVVVAWWLSRVLRSVFFDPSRPPRPPRPPRPSSPPPPPRPDDGARPQSPSGGAERLLPCSACGVRVPEGRGLRDGERFFCSETCRKAGR